jgi:hypothetical protein
VVVLHAHALHHYDNLLLLIAVIIDRTHHDTALWCDQSISLLSHTPTRQLDDLHLGRGAYREDNSLTWRYPQYTRCNTLVQRCWTFILEQVGRYCDKTGKCSFSL